MPPLKGRSTAIQPVQGKRKTFDDSDEDEDLLDQPSAGPSRLHRAPSPGKSASDSGAEIVDDSEEEDEDDAPEAVSSAALRQVSAPDDELALKERLKRQAAASRSRKIAETKAAQLAAQREKKAANKPNAPGSKLKRKATVLAASQADEVAEEDAGTIRLRKRMEAAMAAGDDETDVSEEGRGSGDEQEDHAESSDLESADIYDDAEMKSFHTDSEGEEDDEAGSEDDGGASDDSETLRDGPLSDKELKMRAQMQAMMEAAESRSGVPAGSGKRTKSAKGDGEIAGMAAVGPGEPVSRKRKATGGPAPTHSTASHAIDEQVAEENFDLAPLSTFGRPLSAKVLQAAAAEEEAQRLSAAKAAELEQAREKERKRGMKKKRRLEQKATVRQISDGKHIKMLDPDLPAPGTGLPPVIDARRGLPAGAQSRARFFSTAMKNSGMMPGKGLTDGRRKMGVVGSKP